MHGVSYAQYPGFGDPGARQAGGGGDGLVAVELNVDGGTIPIGATSQVVIRFRNDGSQPVQTGIIRLYPSSTVTAQVALNQCQDEPLPAGAECAIAISVKGLQAGPWRAEMLMTHSGRARLVAATLSGVVEASGEGSDNLTSDIEAVPEEIDFGSLKASQKLVEPVVLRNITSTPIDIKNIYVDTSEQAGYSLKTECATLQAGQSCLALISWSPQLKGRSSGVLVVEHSGPAGLTSVSLQGEYDPDDVDQAEVFPRAIPGKGLLVSSQTEIDFGQDVQTASTITVSLVNSGDADLTIKDITIPGSDNGLSFKGDGCAAGTVLKPIEACPLTVTWSPTRIGTVFDDVQIVHDGARGVLVLPVRGEATSTVSQDQKAIVLSGGGLVSAVDEDVEQQRADARQANQERVAGSAASYGLGVVNPAGTLDGYKITSFSPDRAIINGPGGSRIVFNDEEVVIGGVPWYVMIQKNGIEFLHQGQRVLLLFDRSLSSINRVSASSNSSASASSGGNDVGN
ncbi:MAG: choice-of-anchor D domain-containing protein [Alphaproteobacteria bacterium]|nr:choice-of-anchor D domain-containing protein [Alphaproteobacteria bacterium]